MTWTPASVFIDERSAPIRSRPAALPPGVHPPERFVRAMLRRNVVRGGYRRGRRTSATRSVRGRRWR
jgi:hypothetical protein